MNFFSNLTLTRTLYLLLISLEVAYVPYTFTKSKDTIPVIFIHWGNADFIKHSLWQAKQFNKRVILLADPSTQHYENLGIEWHNIDDYSKSSKYFASIYVHISSAPYEFEIKCFQRWFALEEFMRINNIPIAFHAESDVMLYCDISKEYANNFKKHDASLIYEGPYRGGMVSYWNAKGIKSLTDYFINYYNNKNIIEEALKNYKKDDPGTHYQDDSPLMAYFARANKTTIEIGEINKIINSAIFDFTVWAERHEEEDGSSVYFTTKIETNSSFKIKDIHWINNLPSCYSPTLKKHIRFKSLHFQGSHKNFMGNYRVKKK
jgi:hypothetical protein